MIKLIGAKSIVSKKDGTPYEILHLAYSDPSYHVGVCVDTIFVNPSIIKGTLRANCELKIERSPNGRNLISVEVI